MRSYLGVLVLLNVAFLSAKELYDSKLDRYLIACHSTDFTCFKKQYESFRNHVLLGNPRLGVEEYEPYYFRYGDTGTCIGLAGLEESRLTGVGLDSDENLYMLVLELPLKIQQVENFTAPACSAPAQGPLKRFTGNATIQITFPYELRKKKGQTHMILGEEGLDVILDIPDLTQFKFGNEEDRKEYELSEWAYELVQHIDAAEEFVLPYTSKIRKINEKIPVERYLLLYPEEQYTDIHFAFTDSPFFDVIISKK
ncbi:hypothetical protein ABMA28_002500 [Loxostege sticticalis]|uniref:Uncharacterized protein n=1 Tax=Loxostege sticticalis TaxID=481309 RepID=A0ABD0SX71_LOXSC